MRYRLRYERLDLQSLDGTKMFGVGRQELEAMLEGGGADQRIGQAHAVGERQRIDQVHGALVTRTRLSPSHVIWHDHE